MQEHDRLMADVVASAPRDPFNRPEMSDGATCPEDTPLDVVQDLNVINVVLLCHPLFAGASMIKLAAAMFIMIICTMHGINNKFVDEYINTYFFNRILYLPTCTM